VLYTSNKDLHSTISRLHVINIYYELKIHAILKCKIAWVIRLKVISNKI
jgi:hypothetical protein